MNEILDRLLENLPFVFLGSVSGYLYGKVSSLTTDIELLKLEIRQMKEKNDE
jgi:hypothetical protein